MSRASKYLAYRLYSRVRTNRLKKITYCREVWEVVELIPRSHLHLFHTHAIYNLYQVARSALKICFSLNHDLALSPVSMIKQNNIYRCRIEKKKKLYVLFNIVLFSFFFFLNSFFFTFLQVSITAI